MNVKHFSVFLLCLLFSLVLAVPVFAQYGSGYEDGVFQRAFDILVGVFSLDFLDGDAHKLYGFLRGIIWVAVFTVMYNVLKRFGKGLFTGGSSVVLGAVFATLSVIAIPNDLLEFLAEGYSAVMAAILIGALAVFVLVILYQVLPGLEIKGRLLIFIRIGLLIALLFFLERASGFIYDSFYVLVPLVPGLFPRSGRSGRQAERGGVGPW